MLYSTKRFLIFYALLLLFVANAIGQPGYNLPAVMNPSPQSQAFTKYGNYPMADYTGLVDNTIPLHTVAGKKLSLPITMSFHASGRMANEEDGTLGIRWTLNCGGLVTRTMKGAPDEWYNLTPYEVYPYGAPSFDELYSACPTGKYIAAPFYDSEFDIFSYTLPNGKSGHFILKNENGTKVPMLIPYEALKIELNKGPSNYYERIDITDVDGIKYIFGKVNASTGNAIEITQDDDSEDGLLGSVPTAWYLTKIVSSEEADEISFSYTTRFMNGYYASQTASISDSYRDHSRLIPLSDDPYANFFTDTYLPYSYESGDVITTSGPYITAVPTVSGIQFNGGSVAFNYVNSGPWSGQLLSEMTINEPGHYKKVKFNTSRHAGEPTLFYLDNVSFYGADPNLVNEQYSFSYYEPNPLEGYVTDYYSSVASKDWWGYLCYTGSLLPYRDVEVASTALGGAGGTLTSIVNRSVGYNVSRDGNDFYKKFGMLKTIRYPTGGETEFVYEGNRYDYAPYYQPPQNTATLEGPGLRIKEVISKPGNGAKNIHKIYKYGAYEDGRGHLNRSLHAESAAYAGMLVTERNTMHYWSYDFTTAGKAQGGYRTRDYFSDPYVKFDFSENTVKYDAVTEYYLEGDVPKQKTTSTYSEDYDDNLIDFNVTDREQNILHVRKFSNPEDAWYKPVLTGKAFYKYTKDQNNNEQYDLVKKESYDYTSSMYDEAWDMPTYLHTDFVWVRLIDGTTWISNTDHYEEAKVYDRTCSSIYGYGYRHYSTSNQLMSHSLIEEYTPNGVIKTEKNFDYEPKYGLLLYEELVNSKNEPIKTTYKYPFNFPNIPVYQQMVGKFIISPVIEAATTVNNVQTKKTVTNYYNPSSGVYVPQSVENQTGNNPQEVIATFNRYDNLGHILEQQKANNVKEVYLWGYQSRYPVAKVLNSTYDDAIAVVSQEILDLAGVENNGLIDERFLREYLNLLRGLPGALVETYTYKPYVGMTSSTDANGRTTYYEYDDFGRLTYLRDKDYNIVKKFCYNYAGQTESCPLVAGNSVKSGTFIRNGCTAGYVGAPFTYTVPANTYFGPNADVLAQNDVNTNGQAFADKDGPCVIPVYNTDTSAIFTKDNCADGGYGSSVSYPVPAGRYAAYSQAAANQLAKNDIITNGQNHANSNGYCTWYSDDMWGWFTKNNCPQGAYGGTFPFLVPAGKYSSTISKADANSKALNDFNINGQINANASADCVWYSGWAGGIFYKNDCTRGTGSRVDYSVYAGKYTSTVSQEAADQQAWDEVAQYGQALANENGTCEVPTGASLSFHNQNSYAIVVYLYNKDTEDSYFMVINPYRDEELSAPVGNYEVTCYPDTGVDLHHYYIVGCEYSWGGYGAITFPSVYFGEGTNCNSFYFN